MPPYKTKKVKALEWSLGKQCSEIKARRDWKKYEIFRIKTGENKGEFEKEPDFNKWLKHIFENNWKEVRSLMLKYERTINQIDSLELELEKLKIESFKMERIFIEEILDGK